MLDALLEALKAMYDDNREEMLHMVCDLMDHLAEQTDNGLDDYISDLIRKALTGA